MKKVLSILVLALVAVQFAFAGDVITQDTKQLPLTARNFINQLFGGSPAQIEYAAEMGLEHHLGMTCDPVCGLVQIPCIERNAYAAARALDANLYSSFTDGMHRVSFDKVVEVMKETGNDLPSLYKETSEGGLAKDYKPM